MMMIPDEEKETNVKKLIQT